MIYFHNPTEAPVEALVTLGVSVKSEGAIGWFGTGFKFALATLLRTGHRVWLNDEPFGVRRAEIRGESFNIVTFRDRDLGFTDQLGKGWKVWQAFRELHANALDEGGGSTRIPTAAPTVIRVEGPEIEQAFDDRHNIFIERPAILEDDHIRIHQSNGSSNIYYRNVLAGRLDMAPGIYTYNLLTSARLSDDRTLTSTYMIEAQAVKLIMESAAEEMIERLVLTKGTWEERWIWAVFTAVPSQTFLSVVGRHKSDSRLNQSALEVYRKKMGTEKAEPEEFTPSVSELQVLERALALVKRLGVDSRPDMSFVESLGPNTLGQYKKGRIYIARMAFDQGARRLAGTIYEEWLHKTHGFDDCSRSMQNYLLDKLIMEVDR